MTCPFCERLGAGEVISAREGVAAVWDAYPVSPGHALIVPRRHEADFLALSEEEHRDMWMLLPEVIKAIEGKHRPQGYNLGVNVGRVAGQTVGHAHFHVIPRYEGDVEDPRGGVRWVVPGKAKYWP